jgi:hypothetical protein
MISDRVWGITSKVGEIYYNGVSGILSAWGIRNNWTTIRNVNRDLIGELPAESDGVQSLPSRWQWWSLNWQINFLVTRNSFLGTVAATNFHLYCRSYVKVLLNGHGSTGVSRLCCVRCHFLSIYFVVVILRTSLPLVLFRIFTSTSSLSGTLWFCLTEELLYLLAIRHWM